MLSQRDFVEAAAALGCEIASIRAVCEVEAPRGGFLPDGQVAILFERHKFSEYTRRRFDDTHPSISNRTPGGYIGGAAEHRRLQQAAALDRDAALRATSWGRFQILGNNFRQAGFTSVQGFINAMHKSERAQLDAFVNFIKADPVLLTALRYKQWATFARRYNGPRYAVNRYDIKLAEAYRRYA